MRIFLLLVFVTICVARSLPSASRQTKYPRFTKAGCTNLPTLVCNIQPTDGNKCQGVVYFTPVWHPRSPESDLFTCYTRVTAAVEGLTGPKHGFHVHTYGDLSHLNGSSTGGHFSNPAGAELPHGYPGGTARHWGDLGNLDNDGSGFATYDRVDMIIRLGSVVGRAITIHAEMDQGADEQPSGASGPRVGFCTIGYANPDVIKTA